MLDKKIILFLGICNPAFIHAVTVKNNSLQDIVIRSLTTDSYILVDADKEIKIAAGQKRILPDISSLSIQTRSTSVMSYYQLTNKDNIIIDRNGCSTKISKSQEHSCVIS